MRTITLFNTVGGTGKTALAIHLTAAAQNAGLKVALFDTDPKLNAAGWCHDHTASGFETIAATPARLSSGLAHARDTGAQLAIVDTASGMSFGLSDVLAASDMILVPCRPTLANVNALAASIALTQQMLAPIYLVWTKLAPQSPQPSEDVLAAVAGFGFKTAPLAIQQSAVYPLALAQFQTVAAFDPNGQPAAEIGRLWAWVSHMLYLDRRRAAAG